MRSDEPRLAEAVLRHIAEIGAGTCSITDESVEAEKNPSAREILIGLLMLHEDLEYARQQQARLLDELRGAVQARNEFLLVASHELRTPITTLALQVDGLLRATRDLGPAPLAANFRRKLEIARRQVDRLTALVAALVDVSRITSGHVELSKERADLAEVVRAVAERLGEDARASGSPLRLDDVHSVWGDFDVSRVDQVITNLVSNAIRYGLARPITIGTLGESDRALLWVKDQGIGIRPEDQRRIFQRFERAASSANYAGLGLGLWITRRLVEGMGGTISVCSDIGSGAQFTVELPTAA